MSITQRISPMARAILVIGAVAALVSSITFAALQSQATLTDNTINSATADLLVNNKQDEDFHDSEEGFDFDVVPGGGPSDPKSFALMNNGDVNLDVSVQVTGESALPSGVAGDDITFDFNSENVDCGDLLNVTWATIISSQQALVDDLGPEEVCDYDVTVTVSDDVTSESVNISDFDFTFTGVADPVEEVASV